MAAVDMVKVQKDLDDAYDLVKRAATTITSLRAEVKAKDEEVAKLKEQLGKKAKDEAGVAQSVAKLGEAKGELEAAMGEGSSPAV